MAEKEIEKGDGLTRTVRTISVHGSPLHLTDEQLIVWAQDRDMIPFKGDVHPVKSNYVVESYSVEKVGCNGKLFIGVVYAPMKLKPSTAPKVAKVSRFVPAPPEFTNKTQVLKDIGDTDVTR